MQGLGNGGKTQFFLIPVTGLSYFRMIYNMMMRYIVTIDLQADYFERVEVRMSRRNIKIKRPEISIDA